jgi:hypothetical protein
MNVELKTHYSELRIIIIFIFSISTFLSGCSHGLEPPTTQLGFGGTIYFVSPWPHPPTDSVYDIRVVAFYNYPPQNIINEVLAGEAKVYPPLVASAPTLFVDSLTYSFDLDSSSTFQYVAVAMQYDSVLTDWKVVGAYGYKRGVGSPDSVVVQNTFVNGINIDVDFKNTPPTPSITSVTAVSK